MEDKFECRNCGEDKLVSEFIKDSSRKRGHHPYCKTCQNIIKNNNRAKERAANWNKNNPKRRSEIQKEWWRKNPELRRIYKSQRRLRESDACDGTITKKSLSKLQKDKCSICEEPLKWEESNQVHLDHILALINGGKHSIDNVQWTCCTCNLKKNRF